MDDHAFALHTVLTKGELGETYNIGGHNEKKNIDVVRTICDTLDMTMPKKGHGCYRDQITFVTDRPGHDFRYAIDAGKIEKELDWEPRKSFESGIRKTIEWYLENLDWVETVTEKNYDLQRLGIEK